VDPAVASRRGLGAAGPRVEELRAVGHDPAHAVEAVEHEDLAGP
jgi:hypothetical protein